MQQQIQDVTSWLCSAGAVEEAAAVQLAEEAGLNAVAFRQALQDKAQLQATLAAQSAFCRCGSVCLWLGAPACPVMPVSLTSAAVSTCMTSKLS